MAEAPVENAPGSRKAEGWAKPCDGKYTPLNHLRIRKKKMSAIYDVLEPESNLTSFEHSLRPWVLIHILFPVPIETPPNSESPAFPCLKVLADEIAAPFREEIRQVDLVH